MGFRDTLDSVIKREEEIEEPEAELTGYVLVIDCRRCRLPPVPASKECLSCMVKTMSEVGATDRIILRTGRDTEISGRAGKAIKEAASVRRWSIPSDKVPMRCRSCDLFPEDMIHESWKGFPESFDKAVRSKLLTGRAERDECRDCINRTLRILDQTEEGIKQICDSMGGMR